MDLYILLLGSIIIAAGFIGFGLSIIIGIIFIKLARYK